MKGANQKYKIKSEFIDSMMLSESVCSQNQDYYFLFIFRWYGERVICLHRHIYMCMFLKNDNPGVSYLLLTLARATVFAYF